VPQSIYRGRRAAFIENCHLRVTFLTEGAHIAEIFEITSGYYGA